MSVQDVVAIIIVITIHLNLLLIRSGSCSLTTSSLVGTICSPRNALLFSFINPSFLYSKPSLGFTLSEKYLPGKYHVLITLPMPVPGPEHLKKVNKTNLLLSSVLHSVGKDSNQTNKHINTYLSCCINAFLN